MKMSLPNQIVLLRLELMRELKFNSTTKLNTCVFDRINKKYEGFPKLDGIGEAQEIIVSGNFKEIKENTGLNMTHIYVQELIDMKIEILKSKKDETNP